MAVVEKMYVKIFDTTLRDGEQSPGVDMNSDDKLRIVRGLEALDVDIVEAGFPAASQSDFDAVHYVAANTDIEVAALARANESDIKKAWEAISHTANPRIHTFLATSDLHLKHKLKIDRKTALEQVINAVQYAKTFTDNVEFSAEDASRSDRDYLCMVFGAAIKAGATTINIPDTVGYAVPDEFGGLVRYVMDNTPDIDRAVVSVHCHNDLGLAVANTIAGIMAGARQAEVTINGIGERAGNAALDQIVMAMKTRANQFPVETKIKSEHIYSVSQIVSQITGIKIQHNWPITGKNAFRHESGIHQDGVIKNPMTYEIMTPESVGLTDNELVFGKHSGSSAVRRYLEDIGYSPENQHVKTVLASIKERSKVVDEVTPEDVEAMYLQTVQPQPFSLEIESFGYHKESGYGTSITLHKNGDSRTIQISPFTEPTTSRELVGTLDTIRTGIARAMQYFGVHDLPHIKDFNLGNTSPTSKGLALSSIVLDDEYNTRGWGSHGDIVQTAGQAYMNAVNAYLQRIEMKK